MSNPLAKNVGPLWRPRRENNTAERLRNCCIRSPSPWLSETWNITLMALWLTIDFSYVHSLHV
ncbi:hypothetical protein P5673_010843 [Acropora cervicornis]|uniref:Uncharacterized protein n=1 Tax=Acropora cervicornis TaxID=6130 RepID=A0AAD9QRB4_ACRCE|nr:hypothetical protein P5673_010843 [Acropora cervicornis]